jgi:acetylornithine deacetylase/succinyl-diaminopimelate desuccinylase-like protein
MAAMKLGILLLATLLQVAPPPQSALPPVFTKAMAERADVKMALGYIDANFDKQVAEWITLTEIPALSTHEEKRAAYVMAELAKIPGLDVSKDEIGNITVIRRGTGGGPNIVMAAHMDTVHPMDADLKVKKLPDGTLHAPGIFDNTASVANALQTLRAMNAARIRTKGDIYYVFTVQEELGLKGMYYWFDHHPNLATMIVASDGGLPDVNYGALGIYWSKMKFTAPGAHTLNSRNQPHPARAAAACITGIYTIQLPPASDPVPVIYNVGMMGGGTVVNAIAPENWFTVDLRTIDPALLQKYDTEIMAQCDAAAAAFGVTFAREFIQKSEAGGRPEALAPRLAHPIVRTPVEVLKYLDMTAITTPTGSTDANVGIVHNVPSVSIGRAKGGNQHSLSEWADEASAKFGAESLLLIVIALAELANPG